MVQKKWQSRGVPTSLTQTAMVGKAAEKSAGTGQLIEVPLGMIRIDFNQPRTSLKRLGLTPDEIVRHCDGDINLLDEKDPEKKQKFEAIIDLANSIKSQGLINNITLNRDNQDDTRPYTVETGGRRFLASTFLRCEEIKETGQNVAWDDADATGLYTTVRSLVKVGKHATTKTRARQFVENFHRESLSLDEQLVGLINLNEAHHEDAGKDLEATDIMRELGVSQASAYRLARVLKSAPVVRDAVLAREVTSFHQFDAVKGAKTEAEVQSILAETKPTEMAPLIKEAKKKPAKKKAGRKTENVSLGKTKDASVVEKLMSKYLGKRKFEQLTQGVDWSNKAQVSELWKKFVHMVEGEGE